MVLDTNYNAGNRGLYYQQTPQATAVAANKEATISAIRYIGYLVRNIAAVELSAEGIALQDALVTALKSFVSALYH